MSLIIKVMRYLKARPWLAFSVLTASLLAAAFEGLSFGMIIPLVESMVEGPREIAAAVPHLEWINEFLSTHDTRAVISVIFLAMLALIILKNVFVYLSEVLIAKMRFITVRDLRKNLMSHLLDYDLHYFDTAKTGHMINNLYTQTERMGDVIKAVLQLLVITCRVSAYLVILFLISPYVTASMFVMMLVVLLPLEIIVRKIKRVGVFHTRATHEFNFRITELLGGIRLIKSSATEKMEKDVFNKRAEDVYTASFLGNVYRQMVIPLSEISIFTIVVGLILVLINAVKINVQEVFPMIAAYLLVLVKMLTQVNSLNNNRSEAVNKLASFDSYEELYDASGKKTIEDRYRVIGPFSRAIVFDDVTFSYVKGKEVLNHVDLTIKKGEITALVGGSGAGKSTIVNLIPRFYEIDAGRITVDGVDLKELSLKNWRKRIGVVSQDIFIFNASIRENISYGHPGISDEDVVKAAGAANAHEFIEGLSEGYDTVLGERGVKLSGGQKQRISIARAILHAPEILILDEATSSLDTETETLITEAIGRLTANRTVVAIAHRLSTILHADNIVVLDDGCIIEQGRHADLLAKGGYYKKLYEAQFKTRSEVNV